MSPNRAGGVALDIARAVLVVARGFRGERLALRASALTYITLFSLVPLLAVALALVESIGPSAIRGGLRGFVFDVLAPGIQPESAAVIERFFDTAGSAAAGTVGFVVLLFSASSLLRHIDHSLNEIWNVRRKRALPVRILSWTAVLFAGPLLAAASFVGIGALRGWLAARVDLTPASLTLIGAIMPVLALTFVYAVVPNARVRFRSALAGGLVAGLGWQLARGAYGHLAVLAFRASPLWGSLGAIPLFLTWLYVNWLIVLFGARLSYAVHHAWFSRGAPDLAPYSRSEALIAARVASALARRHRERAPPPGVRALADELRVTVETLNPVVEHLASAGLVRVREDKAVVPARPLDELTLADTAQAVGGTDPLGVARDPSRGGPLQRVLARAEEDFVLRLARVRWSDLPDLEQATDEAPSVAPAAAQRAADQKA